MAKDPKTRKSSKTGIIGSMYPHVVGGMAPGAGGKILHPQAKEDLQRTSRRMPLMRRKMMKVILMRILCQ